MVYRHISLYSRDTWKPFLERMKEEGSWNSLPKLNVCLGGDCGFQNVIAFAELLNSDYKCFKAVEIRLKNWRPSSYHFHMATCLAQALNLEVQRDISFVLPFSARPHDAAALLYSSANLIKGLKIETKSGETAEGLLPEVAKAIAVLPHLRELALGGDGAVSSEFVRATLLEMIHAKKSRIKSLLIFADGFAGLAAFLHSEAAGCLKTLKVYFPSFGRYDAIELISGLSENRAVNDLHLACPGNGGQLDLTALSIFCDLWSQELSIKNLLLGGGFGGGPNYPFSKHLIIKLAEYKTLNNLEIRGGYNSNISGKPIGELLCSNQALKGLFIVTICATAQLADLCASITNALGRNRGLKRLRLEHNLDESGDDNGDAADLSGIIDRLIERDVEHPLHYLCFCVQECPITISSWTSLKSFLQQVNCTLRILDISFSGGKHSAILSLIEAIKRCRSLIKVRLRFSDMRDENNQHNTGSEIVSQIFTEALGVGMSNLINLSLDLSLTAGVDDDFDDDEKEAIKVRALRCMESNNDLETVSLLPLDTEPGFRNSIKAYCLRNKTNKTAIALQDGTLAPNDLPPILERIERMCEQLGFSTGLYFTNIWFSLIKSRPLEAAKYCP